MCVCVCVCSDDSSKNELSFNISTKTLDQILTATLSEPNLESVLPSTTAPSTQSIFPTTVPSTAEISTASTVSGAPLNSTGASSASLLSGSPVCAGPPSRSSGHKEVAFTGTMTAARDYAGLISEETLEDNSLSSISTSASATRVTFSSSSSPAMHGFQDVLTLAKKRPRIETTPSSSSTLEFPSEQDIDSFLDQIHQ